MVKNKKRKSKIFKFISNNSKLLSLVGVFAFATVGVIILNASRASQAYPRQVYLIVRGGPTNVPFVTTNHDLGDCYGRSGAFYTSGASVYCSGNTIGNSQTDAVFIYAPSISGYSFTGWQSSDQVGCNNINPCAVYMPANGLNTLQAIYKNNAQQPVAKLIVNVNGSSGVRFTSSLHDTGSCIRSFNGPATCQGFLIGASPVDPTIISAPQNDGAGHVFVNWSGCNAVDTSGTNCGVYVLGGQTLSIAANYRAAPPQQPPSSPQAPAPSPQQAAILTIKIKGVPSGSQTQFTALRHWIGGCHDSFAVVSPQIVCTSGAGLPIGNSNADPAQFLAQNFSGYSFLNFSGEPGGNAAGCFSTSYNLCNINLKPGQNGIVDVNYSVAPNSNPNPNPTPSLPTQTPSGPTVVKYDASNCDNTTEPLLMFGSQGDCVASLQAILGITQTGYFDSLTQNRVVIWQGSSDLKADGVVGTCTWSTLLGQQPNPSCLVNPTSSQQPGNFTPPTPAPTLPSSGGNNNPQPIQVSECDSTTDIGPDANNICEHIYKLVFATTCYPDVTLSDFFNVRTCAYYYAAHVVIKTPKGIQ